MALVFRGAGVEAAKIAGRDPLLDRVAERMAALIRTTAAPNRDSGAYIASVTVKNVRGKSGVRDRLVTVNDPGAESIEWGRATGDGAGGTRWVPGQLIVTRAYRAMRAVE